MWILPSRGRPQNVARLAELAPEAPITLWLSEDDPRLDDYGEIPRAWTRWVGPSGLRLAQILSEFYRRHPQETSYGFLGDDVIPSPDGWWAELEESAGEWRFAFPDDGYWGSKLSPHFCIGGDLVRAVGWFMLPKLKHNYIDTTWWVISKLLGLQVYRSDVLFDHLHPLMKRAPGDETYKRGQQTYEWDRAVFERWKVEGLANTLQRVREKLPAELRDGESVRRAMSASDHVSVWDGADV